ncbi:MAG: EamA family transporter [Bellilinea sp.]
MPIPKVEAAHEPLLLKNTLQLSGMDANWVAILSAGAGGIAALLARRMMRLAPTRDMISVNFGMIFLMLLPAAPFFWHFEFSWLAVVLFLLAALIDVAANIFYYLTFEKLPAVTASAVMALSPLAALALQPWLTPGFHLSLLNILGIGLVVGGLILLARGSPNGGSGKEVEVKARHLAYPLLAALLFGVNVFPVRMLIANQWTNPYSFYLLRALLIAALTGLALRPQLSWLSGLRAVKIGGRLLFVIAQWLLLLTALEKGSPAVVKTLADTSPLFVLALSGVVLGEKVNRWQALGALLTVAGMALAVR